MTELTQKQKENRAYYARHAEEICAKKREAYQKARNSNTATDKPPDNKPARKTVTQEDGARRETRRRIEDWHLARELEIESF